LDWIETTTTTTTLTIKTSISYQVVQIGNPTFSVYIIVLCPESASNDTVTGLNWIPGTDKKDTHLTPARIPGFKWVVYQEHTFTDKRQNTWNQQQNRFLPLQNCDIVIFGNVTNCHKMSHFFKSVVQCYVYLLYLDPAIRMSSAGVVKQIHPPSPPHNLHPFVWRV